MHSTPEVKCVADYVTDRLYWVDAKNHNIGTCKLDGSDNRLVYANLGALKHPFAITVFEVVHTVIKNTNLCRMS